MGANSVHGNMSTKTQCSICLDKIEIELEECTEKQALLTQTLECSHSFHTGCLQTWLKKKFSCPMCRQDVEKPPLNKSLEAIYYGSSYMDNLYSGRFGFVDYRKKKFNFPREERFSPQLAWVQFQSRSVGYLRKDHVFLQKESKAVGPSCVPPSGGEPAQG